MSQRTTERGRGGGEGEKEREKRVTAEQIRIKKRERERERERHCRKRASESGDRGVSSSVDALNAFNFWQYAASRRTSASAVSATTPASSAAPPVPAQVLVSSASSSSAAAVSQAAGPPGKPEERRRQSYLSISVSTAMADANVGASASQGDPGTRTSSRDRPPVNYTDPDDRAQPARGSKILYPQEDPESGSWRKFPGEVIMGVVEGGPIEFMFDHQDNYVKKVCSFNSWPHGAQRRSELFSFGVVVGRSFHPCICTALCLTAVNQLSGRSRGPNGRTARSSSSMSLRSCQAREAAKPKLSQRSA